MVVNKILRSAFPDSYKDFDQVRSSGRSLGLAYKAIGNALTHAGSEVKIRDHHTSPRADARLFEVVNRLVRDNGLNYMVLNRSKLTIKFDLYVVEGPRDVVIDGVLYREVV